MIDSKGGNQTDATVHFSNARRLAHGSLLVPMMLVAAVSACSPYVYKNEITTFGTGVDELSNAYTVGRKAVATDRAARQRWDWLDRRAKLARTSGCDIGPDFAPAASEPCSLREVAVTVPSPGPIEVESSRAKEEVQALRDYAAALAKVTAAADRQALDAAQAELKAAVVSAAALAVDQDQGLAAQVGPVADLFAATAAAALDTRRYKVLKAGVMQAQEPVRVLGGALGETLDALRVARGRELSETIKPLSSSLGPQLDSPTYAARLDVLQRDVEVLERLRVADPKQAAAEMVKAHDALAAALADETIQVKEVIINVKSFFEKAKAVREAFTDAA